MNLLYYVKCKQKMPSKDENVIKTKNRMKRLPANFCICNSKYRYGAVSYTHLDVYKRQIQFRSVCKTLFDSVLMYGSYRS